MTGHTPPHHDTGIAQTPVERARGLVLTVHQGPVSDGNGWLLADLGGTLSGGPQRFTLATAAGAMTVELSADTLACCRAGGGTAASGRWPTPATSPS